MISKEPVISIITPYYNGQDYIEETAKSVLSQTFQNFEWIIIDDGSNTEGLKKLEEIEKMDSRIKCVQKTPSPNSTKCVQKTPSPNSTFPNGPAQARDLGIQESSKSAKYIVFLDADDLLEKTFLECAYWTLETHPEASWTYTDSINFGAKNFLWRKWYDPEWEKKENILIVTSCIRKTDLLEVGCFGIKEKRVYEDWYLWLKLIKAEKYPVRMSSTLLYYRQKEGESELKKSNTQNKKNAMKIVKQERRDIVNYKQGIQFPKYDYNWEKIEEQEAVNEDKFHPSNHRIQLYNNTTKTPEENEINNEDKTNVLMIIPWMITGGADRFNLNLISKLDKEKFNFTIITTLPATNEWREKFEKYAGIYDLTTFLDMKDWTSFITHIIKQNNINLIFNSNSEFGYKILPFLKAKFPQIPIVDYVHMEEWYLRNGGYSRDSSMVQSVIDKTFTCNENSKKVFINHFNRNANEIETVYIGVDEQKFNPENFNKQEILKELNIHENKNIISFICRITDQKRPFLFFEVIKALAEKRDDFIVIVAGDGPMLEELKRKVIQAKLKDYFVFLGNYEETEKIYKISDVTVNTSIKEGLALTSYESLAMGVPVVSSNVGGQAELINKNVGIIVPCLQDENEILNFDYKEEEILNYVYAILEILENKEIYRTNCRERVLNNFTINKMIEKMDKELTQIAKNPNKEKIENGEKLQKNIDILKELISTYFVSSKQEYEWLTEEFNNKNVHIKHFKGKKPLFYEHTLEYKIKHPIVLALRKIGMYERTKRILGI